MTDRAYGYYVLDLFDGKIELPLKLCMSYPGENYSGLTRTGVGGVPTKRIYVLPKKDITEVKNIEDIDRILEFGHWETYLNIGTATKPILESLDKYEGVKELLEEDKMKSKERSIQVLGIYKKSGLKPINYNGRHFHTYPQTEKDKINEQWHNIYRLLALYLEESFILCSFFGKGEELGALYNDEGVLRISGLHASKGLKPVLPIVKFQITKGLQRLVNEKFDKMIEDGPVPLVLEWSDYVQDVLNSKGLGKGSRGPLGKKKVIDEDKDLKEMFMEL